MASLLAADKSKAHLSAHPPAPSTAGDSDSTAPPQPTEQSIDVDVLRDLAKTGLLESLNAVSLDTMSKTAKLNQMRSKALRLSFSMPLWPAHWVW